MKKQLFSLVMLLALIVIASTSAWAQNTALVRQILITGSKQLFTVTDNINSTFAWTVYNETTSAAATAADITTAATGTGNSVTVEWDEGAVGNYYIEFVETRKNTGIGENCANTTRRFYVALYDFDVRVFLSNSTGASEYITADSRADCGNGTTANYSNEAGAAFNNNGGVAGDLVPFIGINGTNSNVGATATTRYVSFTITWSAAAITAGAPIIGSVGFNYAVTSTHLAQLVSVNGQTPVAGAGLTYVSGAGLTYTIPIVWNDRWGADIISSLYANNFTLYNLAGGPATVGQRTIGVEPLSKIGAAGSATANTTLDETILGSPATTIITFTPQ